MANKDTHHDEQTAFGFTRRESDPDLVYWGGGRRRQTTRSGAPASLEGIHIYKRWADRLETASQTSLFQGNAFILIMHGLMEADKGTYRVEVHIPDARNCNNFLHQLDTTKIPYKILNRWDNRPFFLQAATLVERHSQETMPVSTALLLVDDNGANRIAETFPNHLIDDRKTKYAADKNSQGVLRGQLFRKIAETHTKNLQPAASDFIRDNTCILIAHAPEQNDAKGSKYRIEFYMRKPLRGEKMLEYLKQNGIDTGTPYSRSFKPFSLTQKAFVDKAAIEETAVPISNTVIWIREEALQKIVQLLPNHIIDTRTLEQNPTAANLKNWRETLLFPKLAEMFAPPQQNQRI